MSGLWTYSSQMW